MTKLIDKNSQSHKKLFCQTNMNQPQKISKFVKYLEDQREIDPQDHSIASTSTVTDYLAPKNVLKHSEYIAIKQYTRHPGKVRQNFGKGNGPWIQPSFAPKPHIYHPTYYKLPTGTEPEPVAFKVVLVGDGATGKSNYVKRLLSYLNANVQPTRRYVATIFVNVYNLQIETSIGTINLKFWDTAGQEKFGGLRCGYYINSDAVMYFHDLCSPESFKSLTKWHDDVKYVSRHGMASVIVSTNCEHDCFKLSKSYRNFFNGPEDFPCDSIEDVGITSPITSLLRQLTGKSDLTIPLFDKLATKPRSPLLPLKYKDTVKNSGKR